MRQRVISLLPEPYLFARPLRWVGASLRPPQWLIRVEATDIANRLECW